MSKETITPSLEDYLEAVLVTGIDKKVVRVKDISCALKVRAPSVIGAMKILEDKGFILHERYGYIELTRKGKRKAKEVYKKHKVLSKFFNEVLGIDEKTADADACKMEHYIGEKTIQRIVEFIRFIETCPEEPPIWLSSFREFVKTGKVPKICRKRLNNNIQ